jgi:hypothetical protein
MKSKNLLLSILCFTIAVFIWLSCHKPENKDTTLVNQIQSEVLIWKESLISDTVTISRPLSELINNLDFHDCVSLRDQNGNDIILVHLKNQGTDVRYLSLIKSESKYQFYGIFETIKIDVLKRYFEDGKLNPNEFFKVYAPNNQPLYGLHTDKNGRQFSDFKKSKSGPIQANISPKSLSTKKNKASDDCQIDWYWVTYDPATGEVISEQYLYSTSCFSEKSDEFSGGIGGGGNEPAKGDWIPNSKLCASYNWSKIQQSYTVGINKLNYEFGSKDQILYATIPNACITLPEYGIFGNRGADLLFNEAFNTATTMIVDLLNSGVLIKSDFAVSLQLRLYLQTILAVLKPGATFTNGPCLRNVGQTTLNYQSFCN